MGVQALEQYGKDNVAFFCDNAKDKWGTFVHGIEVLSFEQMVKVHRKYEILVTPVNNFSMIAQLENSQISNYKIYIDKEASIIAKGKKDEELFAYQNSILEEYSTKTDELDMLSDIAEFQKLAEEIQRISKKENMWLAYQGYNLEGCYYGNAQNLLKYAGVEIENIKFMPTVSHQDCFPLYSVGTQYRNSVIFPGTYFKKEVHRHFPYIPVFSVGPYIHYANGIYSRNQIDIIKKQIGRTLLVYMPHSIENINREFSKKNFIDNVLQHYGKEFSKTYLCMYWADVNDPICEYAMEKGMTVVSAGFRFDKNFNSRQKSLLELADAVVFGDVGTFISYALYMRKPVGRVEITNNSTISDKQYTSEEEKKLQFNLEYKRYCKQFYNIFSDEIRLDKCMYEWSDPLNGFEQIKTPDEIREIISISRDIIEECDDRLNRYDDAVHSVLLRYKKNDEKKYNILKEAISI